MTNLELPASTSTPAPKIGIIDLLALTFAFALVFGVYESIPPKMISPNPTIPLWYVLFRANLIIPLALWITWLFVIIREAINSKKLVRHPGYLLILQSGMAALLSLAILFSFGQLAKFMNIDGSNWGSNNVFHMTYIFCTSIQYLIVIVASSIGVFVFPRWWWKIAFALNVLLHLSYGLSTAVIGVFLVVDSWEFFGWLDIISGVSSFLLYAFSIWLFVCAAIEIRSKVSRNWLHWCGVIGTIVFGCINGLLWWISQIVLTPEQIFGR